MGTSKTVESTPDPSVVAAEKRCTLAHSSLASFQKVIIEIIAARDWETLGYENFAKFWVDRFSDISLALEIRPHVVYELLREGSDIDSIADAVKGIGVGGAATLKQKRDSGVPPELATVTKPKRRRKSTKDVVTVFIQLSPTHRARWEAKAAQRNMELIDFIIEIIDATN
jgi:hypothetical protein